MARSPLSDIPEEIEVDWTVEEWLSTVNTVHGDDEDSDDEDSDDEFVFVQNPLAMGQLAV